MITLLKASKRNKEKNIKIAFDTYEELEKYMSKVSTSRYECFSYSVTSEDFFSLVNYFKETYNVNYYNIDYDLCTISINKLEVGEKRKKSYNIVTQGNRITIESAIKHLKKQNSELEYDKDLNAIVYNVNSYKVELFVGEDMYVTSNVIILPDDKKYSKYEDFKEVIDSMDVIKKYFKYLKKRLEKGHQ